MLKVKNKDIVIPGEILAEGMDYVPTKAAYRVGDKIYAYRVGLVEINGRVIKVIPLSGGYIPTEGDTVIGVIKDILVAGWKVYFGSPYEGVLPIKEAVNEFVSKGTDLRKYYDIGDIIFTKIITVTSQMLVDLTMKDKGLKKLVGGRIIKITPAKVPRVIGKKASMISMLKKATNCKIVVGKNGFIWIDGSPRMEVILEKAIRIIEEEAHTTGLTERIKEFLEKETNKKIQI